ncbi:hypothetical protein ACLOJK_023678 [Asimina triloba]
MASAPFYSCGEEASWPREVGGSAEGEGLNGLPLAGCEAAGSSLARPRPPGHRPVLQARNPPISSPPATRLALPKPACNRPNRASVSSPPITRSTPPAAVVRQLPIVFRLLLRLRANVCCCWAVQIARNDHQWSDDGCRPEMGVTTLGRRWRRCSGRCLAVPRCASPPIAMPRRLPATVVFDGSDPSFARACGDDRTCAGQPWLPSQMEIVEHR